MEIPSPSALYSPNLFLLFYPSPTQTTLCMSNYGGLCLPLLYANFLHVYILYRKKNLLTVARNISDNRVQFEILKFVYMNSYM